MTSWSKRLNEADGSKARETFRRNTLQQQELKARKDNVRRAHERYQAVLNQREHELAEAMRKARALIEHKENLAREAFLAVIADEAPLITKNEVSRITNTSPSTVYRWIKEHEDNQKEQEA